MIGAKPVAHTPNEHCDVGALTPTIGVKLIQYDKFDTVRVRNDSAIQRILARHQQFKHHEVRKEDVRLLFADALALFLALLASVAGEHRPQRLGQSARPS
jgi:hypothetical protein